MTSKKQSARDIAKKRKEVLARKRARSFERYHSEDQTHGSVPSVWTTPTSRTRCSVPVRLGADQRATTPALVPGSQIGITGRASWFSSFCIARSFGAMWSCPGPPVAPVRAGRRWSGPKLRANAAARFGSLLSRARQTPLANAARASSR
jgi:hypothetical protein